jgi:hypothetical protein
MQKLFLGASGKQKGTELGRTFLCRKNFNMSLKVTEMPREKFEKTFNEFKKDPFATARPMMTQEIMSKTIPGMDGTIGDMMKKQEKMYKDFFNANNNPIELTQSASTDKKKK